MSYTEFDKSPDAVLDYTFDWSQWIPLPGTIQSSTWSSDDGITIDSNLYTDDKATVFLSGGVIGRKYIVSNTIVTNTGLTETRSFIVHVQRR